MKPIGYIDGGLLFGRWVGRYHILYIDMMRFDGIPTPSIQTPSKRTLMIIDIKQ